MPVQRQIAIGVSESAPGVHADDVAAVQWLRERGVAATPVIWSDARQDWSRFDAVLIRSTWDYHLRYPEFLRWLARLDEARVWTINATPVLRWNSDKRYLLALEAHGVAIPRTMVCSHAQLQAALDAFDGDELVIKPAVSAGAWATVRGQRRDAELLQRIAALPPTVDYLVQPFIEEIITEGEFSVLFFAGEYSHAVCKRPASNDYRVQGEFGGRTEFIAPSAQMMRAAEQAMWALGQLGFGDIVYARIDGVLCGGRCLIMEVELIEPSLFLAGAQGAAERFAAAVMNRLERASR